MRSVRLTWWIAGLSIVFTALAAAGYSALVSTMMAADPNVNGLEAVVMIVSKPSTAPVSAAVLGVFAVGNDYRYGTICATLLVTPRRRTALAAKALVVAGFGAAVAVADLAVAWAIGTLMLGRRLIAPASALDLLHLHGAQIALTVGWALLGTFVAILVRSQVAALTAMLAFPFAVEPAFRTMVLLSGRHWLEMLVGFLPFSAGNAMTDISHGSTSTLLASTAVRLGPLAGGLVFFGMTAVVGTWALLRFQYQDVK